MDRHTCGAQRSYCAVELSLCSLSKVYADSRLKCVVRRGFGIWIKLRRPNHQHRIGALPNLHELGRTDFRLFDPARSDAFARAMPPNGEADKEQIENDKRGDITLTADAKAVAVQSFPEHEVD